MEAQKPMKDAGDVIKDPEFGPDALRASVDQAEDWGEEAQASALGALWKPLSELSTFWLKAPPEPRRYLLMQSKQDGFLPLGKVGMVVGPGGTGKTQALCQLALSVASGRWWLETYAVAEPGCVLLATAEEDPEELHRRLYYSAGEMGLNDEHRDLAMRRIVALPLAGINAALLKGESTKGLIETPLFRELKSRLERAPDSDAGWKLVILDPISRFMPAEGETDNATATRFVAAVEALVGEGYGRPTVLLSHHVSKGNLKGPTDQTAARGASALTDGVRWQANLELVMDPENPLLILPDRCALRVTKSNYGPRPKGALELERISHGVLGPAGASRLKDEEFARTATKQRRDDKKAARKNGKGTEDPTSTTEHGRTAIRNHVLGDWANQEVKS